MLPVAHTTALYSAPQAKQYACNHHLNAAPLSLNSFAARHRRELITLAPSCMHLHWLTTLVLLTHQHRRRIDPILLQNPIHKWLNADCTPLHHSFITASSPLHHSFITASSPLHHSFITASSPLHHSFITASSRLHHSDQQYSTHCNAQPSHSKSRPTRMAWSPYHPPAYQGICCLRTWLVHRHCGGTRHNPKPALART